MATEHADRINLERIEKLVGQFSGSQPAESLAHQLPVADLPAPVLQVLGDKIREIIEETMQRATKEVFNKQEAAAFLGIKVSSVEKQMALGKLKRAGNSSVVRFTRQALLDYLALTPPPRRRKRKRSTNP